MSRILFTASPCHTVPKRRAECVFAFAAVAGEAGVLDHEDQHQTAVSIAAHVGRIGSVVAEGRTGYRPAKAITLLERGPVCFGVISLTAASERMRGL